MEWIRLYAFAKKAGRSSPGCVFRKARHRAVASPAAAKFALVIKVFVRNSATLRIQATVRDCLQGVDTPNILRPEAASKPEVEYADPCPPVPHSRFCLRSTHY